MDFVELARTRYTTKHYSGKAIPCETMEKLFEVLRLAPSSVNSQPWVYFHARTAEQKEKLLPAILDFNRERVTLASDVIVFAIRDAYDEAMFKRVLDKEIADGRYADETKVEGLDAGRRHFVGLHSETPESLHAWEQAQSYIATCRRGKLRHRLDRARRARLRRTRPHPRHEVAGSQGRCGRESRVPRRKRLECDASEVPSGALRHCSRGVN